MIVVLTAVIFEEREMETCLPAVFEEGDGNIFDE